MSRACVGGFLTGSASPGKWRTQDWAEEGDHGPLIRSPRPSQGGEGRGGDARMLAGALGTSAVGENLLVSTGGPQASAVA